VGVSNFIGTFKQTMFSHAFGTQAGKALCLLALTAMVGFSSCRRCRTCECTKAGQTFIEEKCGAGSGRLNNWQRSIMEESGYEECFCEDDL
jgi:hypothetical protein